MVIVELDLFSEPNEIANPVMLIRTLDGFFHGVSSSPAIGIHAETYGIPSVRRSGGNGYNGKSSSWDAQSILEILC